MAKKRTKAKTTVMKRRRKAQPPAEVTLKYTLPGDGSDIYIDLMRDLSAVNRRLYHQGKVLQISHVTIKQDTGATVNQALQATIKTLPYTWVAAQAYMKARNAWMEQQRSVRTKSGQEAIRPAYEDFKIFMDAGHRNWALTNLPVGEYSVRTKDGAGNDVAIGDWDPSKLVYADQTVDPEVVREPYLHLVGPDVGLTDVGLIQAYEESRATVDGDQPNVPATAASNIYTALNSTQDEGSSDEIITNMLSENDSPPYERNNYPGGDSNYPTNVDKAYVQTSSANPIVHTQSFLAMCGFLRVYSQGKNLTDGSDIPLQGIMQVHLTPGPSKGVLSMNVGDMV